MEPVTKEKDRIEPKKDVGCGCKCNNKDSINMILGCHMGECSFLHDGAAEESVSTLVWKILSHHHKTP